MIVSAAAIVAGSVNLNRGQPGIGKSTLLLPAGLCRSRTDPVLYVSGEESAHQAVAGGTAWSARPELQLLQHFGGRHGRYDRPRGL